MYEQLELELFEPNIPAQCGYELKVVEIGGGKSLCSEMGLWTNCREVGRCTSDHRKHIEEREE